MKMKTEDILKELKELETWNEHVSFIHSLDLTNEQFQILSKKEDYKVRWGIAEYSDLPEDLMYKLADDKDDIIRMGIAQRPDLPEDLKYKLAEDDADGVRGEIAKHTDLPDALKYKLAEDEAAMVRCQIADRPDLPEDLIIRLSCDYSHWTTSYVSFKKIEKLNTLKSEDLENAYDLIRTSKDIGRKQFEKTFNYIISNFPELSEAAKLFKSIILKGRNDLI
jgi:hypothetical protein